MYFPEIATEMNVTDLSDQACAWEIAIQNVYDIYDIDIPLHVWENGFVQGDSSDEDIEALVARLGDDWQSILNVKLAENFRKELEVYVESDEEQ